MKKSILTIAVILLGSISLLANNDEKYYKAMGSVMQELFTAGNLEEMTPVLNKLTRIADAEPEKWEPAYYSAFACIVLSQKANAPTDKDKYVDMALKYIKSANSLAPGEVEIEVLKGYALMMKMVVDPMNRAPEYSGEVFGSFQKALKMDPKNPRAWLLLGQMQLGTSKFTGSGKAEACASIQKSLSLFEAQELPNPVSPSWGVQSATYASKECE